MPGVSEDEVLWGHDIGWVRDTIDRIAADAGRKRRDTIADMLMSMSAAWSGEGAADALQAHIESTFTDAEWELIESADKARREREGAEHIKNMMAHMALNAEAQAQTQAEAQTQAQENVHEETAHATE